LGSDRELFFGPDGESLAAARVREAAAVAVCRGCPVAGECLSWSLAGRIPYGVWGGLSEAERLEVLVAGSGVGVVRLQVADELAAEDFENFSVVGVHSSAAIAPVPADGPIRGSRTASAVGGSAGGGLR
jgi:hypothetical protein